MSHVESTAGPGASAFSETPPKAAAEKVTRFYFVEPIMNASFPTAPIREVTTLAELARKAGVTHPTIRRRIENAGVLPVAVLKVGTRRIPLFVGDELEALAGRVIAREVFDQTRAIQSL